MRKKSPAPTRFTINELVFLKGLLEDNIKDNPTIALANQDDLINKIKQIIQLKIEEGYFTEPEK